MSVVQIRCPKCNGTRQDVVKEHEPETTSMNMRVTLRCTGRWDCGHEWEDRVISHHAEKMRDRGARI